MVEASKRNYFVIQDISHFLIQHVCGSAHSCTSLKHLSCCWLVVRFRGIWREEEQGNTIKASENELN